MHRVIRHTASGGTHFTSGCFDLTGYELAWSDGATWSALNIVPESVRGPAGCLELTYTLQNWECE